MLYRKFLSYLLMPLFMFKKRQLDFEPQNILVIRSGAIGDVLMSTPVLTSLRNKYKEAKITYLVGRWSLDVLKNNPNINTLIEFDDSIVVKRNLLKLLRLTRVLRNKKFDLCFILDKAFEWNLLAFFSGVKFRVGFNRYGEGFSNNMNIKYDGTKYELDYYLDLIGLLGKADNTQMQLFPTQDDLIVVENIWQKKKFSDVIGICPGGATNPGQDLPEKRWPVHKFTQLIESIHRHFPKTGILLLGNNNDLYISQTIIKNSKAKIMDLCGKTSLQQTYELMKKCRLIVTNDSGAMHIAAAARAKVIAIFGPTDPKRFASKDITAITPKDHKPGYDVYGNLAGESKINEITVAEVFDKVWKVLN